MEIPQRFPGREKRSISSRVHGGSEGIGMDNMEMERISIIFTKAIGC